MGNNLTQSAQQTIKFFEEFIRREKVTDFIKEFRKHLGLPPEGLPFTEEDEREIAEPLGALFYIPKRAQSSFPDTEREKPIRIINTCNVFVKQQGVNSFIVQAMFYHYLFFNRITEQPLIVSEASDDLLKLEHVPSELSWFDDEDHFLLKCMYEHFEHISNTHPIALYINPEASQRQITDFISKNWDFIASYRSNAKKGITGIRKKDKGKQERNDFIYEHRHLPHKEIMSMCIAKFGDSPDYANIGKIISLERKRRENK